MRYRPEQHLRRQSDFEHVRGTGRRFDAGPFTLFYAPRRPSPHVEPVADRFPSSSAAAHVEPVADRFPSAPASPPHVEPVADRFPPVPAASSSVPSAAATTPARAGFVASRSAVGNAVARARAKRRLREGFRAHQSAFTSGFDFIFVARRSLNGLEPAALQERFSTLCRKLFPPRAT